MPREFKEDVLFEISKEDTGEGRYTSLRIVSWNNGTPKIEKRMFWTNEEGQLRPGKLSGLTISDFQLILDNQNDIQKYLTR